MIVYGKNVSKEILKTNYNINKIYLSKDFNDKEILNLLKTKDNIIYFPKEEIYSLTNQIRRSAISIPSNIAEGASRNHTKEFVQFLYISLGSCSELETQLLISFKINYLSKEKLDLFLEKTK